MFDFLKKEQTPIRMVIGLNQVDKIVVNGWDERLNMPTKKAEKEIDRRSKDIIEKLAKVTRLSASYIEYYSALKRYRLLHLLNKIIRNAYAGFKLDHIQPADPFELAERDVKEFADEERKKRSKSKDRDVSQKEKLFDQISRILTPQELDMIKKKFKQEIQRPPKVAILGKTGVGKTTTINNLFNANWKTNHTIVGTTEAQIKEFELSTGGTLTVVDLPGYGRSVTEDAKYEEIYKDLIPTCDLVFLVLQADSRDLADDQEIILKVTEWVKSSPMPKR
jgi:predicted GTPase